MIDWDDLRFVLAVSRAGSALRAARALKVNQTTVMRRLARIEAAIGAALFESRQSGQVLTALGRTVAARAERVEAEVLDLESALAAGRRMLTGSVRFTSSEVYANRIVAPFLRSFRQQHPHVTIEFMADDRKLDVSRGEADVALRAGSRPEGGGIVAQRLPDSSWAAYCSRSYAAEHGKPSPSGGLGGHALVLVEGATAKLPAFLWLMSVGRNATVSARSSGLTNLVSTVKAGLGIGMMPCFVGDGDADLMRCLPRVPALDAEVWLIVREEVKHAPHVRAFVDCLSAHMFALRREFAGQAAEGPGAPADAGS